MREEIEEFMAGLEARGRSPATIRAYRFEIERFVAFVGDVAPERIRERDLSLYLMKLAVGNGAAGQRRALAVLRLFFGWLLSLGRIRSDPLADIDLPVVERRSPERLLSWEVSRLLAEVEEVAIAPQRSRDCLIISLLLHAGLKLAELATLRRRAIELAAGYIIVGEGRSRREIPINATLRAALVQHLPHVGDQPDAPLFTNSQGGELTKDGLYYLVKRYMRAAGLDIKDGGNARQDGSATSVTSRRRASPQTLRHTFCAQLLARGANLKAVAELAGHTSPSSTAVYLQSGAADKRSAIRLLDEP